MIRSALIVLCFGVLSPGLLRAQSLSTSMRHFDEGNRRYELGEYEGALHSYERARAAGYESGALYYNMGNAYYRIDAVGQAIRFYEKAKRYMPDSPELDHNLTIARGRVVDRFSQLPEPFWRPAWMRLVGTFGPGGLFGLGLTFYILAAGAVALRIRSGRTPWRRRAAAFGAAAAVCLVSLSFAAAYDQAHRIKAVVLIGEVTLTEEPEGAPSDLQVHEGVVVDVVDQEDEWSEIRLPNGARGWLQSDGLGSI